MNPTYQISVNLFGNWYLQNIENKEVPLYRDNTKNTYLEFSRVMKLSTQKPKCQITADLVAEN